MKRWTLKLLGIVLGMSIGWMAAGWMTRDTLASDHRADHPSLEHADDKPHDDPGAAGLAALVPQADDVPWLGPMLTALVGLFAAAVVIGIPSLKYQTPVSPQAAPSAGHDDHGDAHGHPKAH